MEPRRTPIPRHQLAAGGLALCLAVAAGHALASWRGSEARERLESRNRELRESLGTLAEGLREARRPLQRRIHELERALARSAAPPGEAPPRLAAPEPSRAEPGRAALAARVLELESELASLRAGHERLGRSHESVDAERRALVARVTELEARARSAAAPALPDVAAAPAGARAGCRQGGDHPFDLRDLDEPLRQLGGELDLHFRREQGGLSLVLGERSEEGYPLDQLPQHVAFDCEGVPYVVSICEASREPPRVRGVIWQAGVWRDRCR